MHPTVRVAIEETLREWSTTRHAAATDEQRRAMARFYTSRPRRVLPVLVYGFLTAILLVSIMPALVARAYGFAATLGALALITGALLARNARAARPTLDELLAIAPAVRLTRVGRAYVESLVSLRALKLPRDTQIELEAGLDRLLDEEGRLIAMRDTGIGHVPRPAALEAEREALSARLAAEADPVACEALAHGLATLERRLSAARTLSGAGSRIDAQLEMIAQSAEDVRDGLSRLRSVPGEAVAAAEMDSVREALAHVQGHASALEAAVAEVRAL